MTAEQVEALSVGGKDSVGARLRTEREKSGMSISEAAERLHIIPRYVNAIEEGQFKDLPGTVFLKGYIRSYARLLGLSETRMIETLEDELTIYMREHPELEAKKLTGFSDETTTDKPSLTPLLYALASVILFAGGWWAYNGLISSSKNEQPIALIEGLETKEADNNVTGGESSSTEIAPVDNAELEASRAGIEEVPTKKVLLLDPPVTAESDGADSNLPVSRELPKPAPAFPVSDADVLEETDGAEKRDAPVSSDSTNVLVSADVISDDPQAGTLQSREIQLTDGQSAPEFDGPKVKVVAGFIADCWFDVRDADNQRRVGLYRNGQSLSFEGRYPIKFVIGAADSVSLTVDGEIVDFSRYRVRNNRVEFEITQ